MIAALLLAAVAAHAPVPASATIWGLGNDSCGTWTQEHETNSAKLLMQYSWLGGYITNYNEFNSVSGNLGGTDFAGMDEWVSNYCKAHPLETISHAAIQLVATLQQRQR